MRGFLDLSVAAMLLRGRILVLLAIALGWLGGIAYAQGPRGAAPAKPADYRSTHILLHTDLASGDARELLARLEVILGLISKYWGQPLAGEIECFVVRDLNQWPAEALSEIGRAKIAAKSGITTTQTISRGKRFIAGKSTVYAFADGGTPQHEIVHAYCGQTFGGTGPLWYSEGMAELGQFWQADNAGVRCKPHMIDYLRGGAAKTARQIVADNAPDGQGAGPARSGDSWQAYANRWALCHLLVNNPNYNARFQTLGLAYLNGGNPRFGEVFDSQRDEIEFEYRQFLTHLDQGYRADLCAWDWHHKFREPNPNATSARIMANRGWQPSGAVLAKGQAYEYTAAGLWKLGAGGGETNADGLGNGSGRLEGVVFRDFQLGEPFLLGTSGTFVAPADGKLYLRCRENWSELADNTGQVTAKLKLSTRGPQAPRPASTAEQRTSGTADKARSR